MSIGCIQAMDLDPLLEELYIGRVRLKNRVAMAPMISNLAHPSGYPTDAYIAYLVERARGGVGLIITEYTYINNRDARGSINQLGLYTDEHIPKFRRLIERVKVYGARIFVQLVHVGRKTFSEVISGETPIAPTPKPLLTQRVREMSYEDIKRVQEDFVRAAVRAKRIGFDGVELHGAHGYLIAQFLSPAVNRRVDEYRDGVRFVAEIIEGIKSRVDIVVGLRISVTEFDDEGLNPDMVGRIASRLQEYGLDYIHLSAGRDGPITASAPFYAERITFLRYAEIVRKYTDLPLMLAGSIIDVEDALRARRVVDVVVLGRQLLADPYWLIKNIRGLPVRPCIRCNQLCRGLIFREVRCDVNPEVGWELYKDLPRGEGRVVVVGGGLMGLEAARVLALRGFDVELYEKSDGLGGQLRLVRDPFKVKEFLPLISYYEKELRRLGVKIYTNTTKECDPSEPCLYAVPDEEAPELPMVKGLRVLIDSNIYAYHDWAFELSKYNDVAITRRSFRNLDRSRAYFLEVRLKEHGVDIVDSDREAKADLVLRRFSDNQRTIGDAIREGYVKARNFVPELGQ